MKGSNRRGGSFAELTYGQGSKLVLQLFEAVQDRGGDAADLVRMIDNKDLAGQLADLLTDGWCVVESEIPLVRGSSTLNVAGLVKSIGMGHEVISVDPHLARSVSRSWGDIVRWSCGDRISAKVCRITRDMTVEQITKRANSSRVWLTSNQTLWEFLAAAHHRYLDGKPCLCLDQFAGESTRPENMLRPYWDGRNTIKGVGAKTLIRKDSYVLLLASAR